MLSLVHWSEKTLNQQLPAVCMQEPLKKVGRRLVKKVFELLVSLVSKEIIQKMEPGTSEWYMQGE